MTRKLEDPSHPYHAHVYYDREAWDVARRLHQELCDMQLSGTLPGLVLVGRMYEKGVGPHPKPQFEIQFVRSAVPAIERILRATGLTSLIHPLTDDDLADHTTLADWIGEPIPLDESVLDPPGHNQGIARFGKVDY
jgi:aromatic ring-cleaving dioxygenase